MVRVWESTVYRPIEHFLLGIYHKLDPLIDKFKVSIRNENLLSQQLHLTLAETTLIIK